MRIALSGIFALALFAPGSVSAQPRCQPYPPYPNRCLRPVADGWSLVPGVGSQRKDGMVMTNGVATHLAARSTIRLEAGAVEPSGESGRGAIVLKDHGLDTVYWLRDRWLPYRSRIRGYWDRSPEVYFLARGGLERQIPLEPWRGKRILVALRLRNAVGVRGYVSAWMGRGNETALRTASLLNRQNDTGWEEHALVLDVPDNATELLLFAGLAGTGEMQVDKVAVRATDKDAPLTWTERIDNTGNFGTLSDPPLVPPSPGPVRPDED